MNPLNAYEQQLVQDANILLVKNGILEKVSQLLASLSEQYQQVLSQHQLSVHANIPPKVSRGEKYQGLPYLVLDFPRQFSNDGILAVRTLFWWGKYFSITLHLHGHYLAAYGQAVKEVLAKEDWEDWWLQWDGDMWQHEINTQYVPAGSAVLPPVAELPFLKLAKKIPLQEWDNIENIFTALFEKLAPVFYAPMR